MANISSINGLLIDAATASLATTASYALTVAGGGGGPAFPYVGNAVITGSLIVSGSGIGVTGSINATSITSSFTGSLTGTLIGTASWATNAVTAVTASVIRNQRNTSNTTLYLTAVDSFNAGITEEFLYGVNVTVNPSNASLTATSVTASFTGSLTGALTGTASYATSASQAITASYILQAVSSSFATTAQTLLGSVTSASYALTASYFQGSDNLAAVQGRRTTGFTLPATANFITLDATDVETTPAVVAHDNVNTERIYVYSTGLYLLHYHADVGPGTVSDFEFSIVKNALTTISGSIISGKNSSTDEVTAGVNTLVLLNANDYVALYGRYVATSTGIANNVVFSVTKMEGVIGPAGGGQPGGSTTEIQYNNAGTLAGVPTLTYSSGHLKATGSFTGSFTGSLQGSSSYALTASYALTSAGGGGGGTPGGTVNEVQYNNGAGGFAGAANVEIESGNLKLVSTTDPATPTGGIISYSKVVGGRHLPKIIGPSGVDTVMQVGVHGNSIMMVSPANGTTAPTTWGGVLTTGGTLSHQQTIASSAPWQATRRTRFQTGTTINNTAGMRTAYTQWFRGSAAGFGGFWFRAQFGQNINLTGGQKFIGLCNSTAVIGGDPSALLNMCGMGFDAADLNTGNWQFMYNDGTGTATRVNLNGTAPSLAAAPRDTTTGYDLVMYMAPGGSELFVRIINLVTNVTIMDTSFTTLLPVANTGMAMKAEVRTTTAAADNLEIAKLYIESDY